MKLKYAAFLLALAVLPSSLGLAQNLSEDQIMQNLEDAAASLQDATFLLTGKLIDADGTEIPLEVEVGTIPDMDVARAYFIQPDALADNFIILDGDTVYNYLYLTNQVQVFDAGDPDALGGLFPEAQEDAEQNFNFSLNLERLFEGWQMSVRGYEPSERGNVYLLRFENEAQQAAIDHVDAKVLDESWIPSQLTFVREDGSVLADLHFQEPKLDQGLDPAELRAIPPDAEIIDER